MSLIINPYSFAAAATWQSIFSAPGASNSDGWNGYTYRIRLTDAALTNISGSQVRLTLEAGSTEGLTVTKTYIGLESGGNFQFASPVQMLFAGSASTTISAGQQKTTDAAVLAVDGVSTLVASIYTNGGSGSDMYRVSAWSGAQYKLADEAATTGALSGYTGITGQPIVSIEVLS